MGKRLPDEPIVPDVQTSDSCGHTCPPPPCRDQAEFLQKKTTLSKTVELTSK